MSVVRTIDRLARVVRTEAKRNPEFAARLDAAFRAHSSARKDLALDDIEEDEAVLSAQKPSEPIQFDNPVSIAGAGGADALREAVGKARLDRPALLALIAEHNLDPAGEAGALEDAGLVDLLVSQAMRRVERDRKLFDY